MSGLGERGNSIVKSYGRSLAAAGGGVEVVGKGFTVDSDCAAGNGACVTEVGGAITKLER